MVGVYRGLELRRGLERAALREGWIVAGGAREGLLDIKLGESDLRRMADCWARCT